MYKESCLECDLRWDSYRQRGNIEKWITMPFCVKCIETLDDDEYDKEELIEDVLHRFQEKGIKLI